jgi:hypothetical protein
MRKRHEQHDWPHEALALECSRFRTLSVVKRAVRNLAILVRQKIPVASKIPFAQLLDETGRR